jgi:hypothetical protein
MHLEIYTVIEDSTLHAPKIDVLNTGSPQLEAMSFGW